MKTIAALLMMTSVAGAQTALDSDKDANGKPFAVQPGTNTKTLYDQAGAQSHEVPWGGLRHYQMDGSFAAPLPKTGFDPRFGSRIGPCNGHNNPCAADASPSASYTLVLRDKRGITMLIRRQNEHPHEFDMLKACEDVADELKHSPDILDAQCFK